MQLLPIKIKFLEVNFSPAKKRILPVFSTIDDCDPAHTVTVMIRTHQSCVLSAIIKECLHAFHRWLYGGKNPSRPDVLIVVEVKPGAYTAKSISKIEGYFPKTIMGIPHK